MGYWNVLVKVGIQVYKNGIKHLTVQDVIYIYSSISHFSTNQRGEHSQIPVLLIVTHLPAFAPANNDALTAVIFTLRFCCRINKAFSRTCFGKMKW